MPAPPAPIAPPRDLEELLQRARSLTGVRLGDLAHALSRSLAGAPVHTKGKQGELVERALGATAGSSAVPDFPHLGVELKTIPLDARGVPRESTFVASFQVADAEYAEWETSTTRHKLACVLWVPVHDAASMAERVLGAPLLWRPTPEQEAILRDDFDTLMGIIGVGGIESLTARDGRWLQVRPKAADGTKRAVALGPEGERIATVPKGFYLRARFTGALLADATATPP